MVPIIRLELESIKERFICSFLSHQESFNQMVVEALDKILTVENLQHRIDVEVDAAVNDAIKSISSSPTIQQIILQIVIDALDVHLKAKACRA